LSGEERELLRLCFGKDLERKEIACRMGRHPASIAKFLRRVLARLRNAARKSLDHASGADGGRSSSGERSSSAASSG
jgi:DNA-directed RNA polymerase specialized sigma24 family protein